MNNNIKFVALDLDGTLLDDNKNITKATEKAIKSLKKFNIKIILISGRHLEDIMSYANQLQLTVSDYIVSSDGVHIYNAFGNEIYNSFIKYKDFKSVISNYRKALIVTDKSDYILSEEKVGIIRTIKTFFCKNTRKVKKNISKKGLWLFRFLNVEKIVISKDEKTLFLKKLKVIEYVDKKELMANSSGKLNALKTLMRFRKIESLDSVLYIGDDYNDLECFLNIPCTVAMGNAVEVVKRQASFITKNNNEDGVAFALNKLFDLN